MSDRPRISSDYGEAARILRAGGLVALPTDTVYGLCALAASDDAVRRLYEVKQRDRAQPLPLFVADVRQAQEMVEWNEAAAALAAAFWPGALTIVLQRRREFVTRAAAGGDTIGVRAPGDERIRALASQLGPLTGTSANLATREECRTAAEVEAQLGGAVDLIVDAEVDASGTPSTIVDCTDPALVRIVRAGGISRDDIASAVAGVADVA